MRENRRTVRRAGRGIPSRTDSRPAFREAFARRRYPIPFNCFYEWKKLGKDREPYAVDLSDRRLMALSGVWETWRSPAGERARSFAIVATECR